LSTDSLAGSPRHETGMDKTRQLVREHAREIAESAVSAVYKVPSREVGTYYVVSLSRQVCECRDFKHGTYPCKHLLAAEIVSSKCGTCADCAGRFLGRDLIEVTEDHESLTWFVGDLLCRTCAISHGVL
jgi:hypothetical protein